MLTAIAGLVAMFGAGSTGAWAQEGTLPIQDAVAVVAEAPAADEPRFVVSEAALPLDVQEFGEEAAARYRQATSLQELVGDMPIDAELSADMKCLAEAVYFEARGEPLDGQLAVAKVVINRSTSGLYPTDYCSVITQRAQFSFVRGGRIPQADERSAAWRRAKAVAQIAHEDLWSCAADDAMFFHATYVRPGWASRKQQLARIDTHVFYR
jgi:spore germination cell wall hydrolase CwlJ-like protein